MLLALDTCTNLASLVVIRENRLAAEITWDVGRRHSQELFARLQELLHLAGATPRDLTAIAVARGPGSFNGVRVGVTAAKVLSFVLHLPVYPFASLDVVAYGQSSAPGIICAVLDAGRGEVYAAQYRCGGPRPTHAVVSLADEFWRVSEYAVMAPGALATSLAEAGEPVLFCGEWRPETRAMLASTGGSGARFADVTTSRRAGWLAELALRAGPSAVSDEPATIEPLYLRRPAISVSKKHVPHGTQAAVAEADRNSDGSRSMEG
jgi:tRNA threonylcarbamoyladenosine biosynthesis protein TsaB